MPKVVWGLDNTKQTKTYGEGRVCAHPECETRLSIYNPDDKCSLHAEPDYRMN